MSDGGLFCIWADSTGHRNSVLVMPIQRKTGVCCQNPRMDVGACTSDIYPDEERTSSDLFQRKHRKNAQAGHFSFFPFSLHLDFLFELNEVCM